MTPIGANWKWPEREDVLLYEMKDVVCAISKPVPKNSRGHYKIIDFPEKE